MRTKRPKKYRTRDKNFISQKIKANPFISATNIARELKECIGTDMYAETVRRKLHQKIFHARSDKCKPLVSESNRRKD